MTTATKTRKCTHCGAKLLAGPSGWICSECDAKIVLYKGQLPARLDIVPSGDLPERKLCDECDGTGSVECEWCNGDGYTVCEHCDSEVDCKACDGEGRVECRECGGTGFEEDEQ